MDLSFSWAVDVATVWGAISRRAESPRSWQPSGLPSFFLPSFTEGVICCRTDSRWTEIRSVFTEFYSLLPSCNWVFFLVEPIVFPRRLATHRNAIRSIRCEGLVLAPRVAVFIWSEGRRGKKKQTRIVSVISSRSWTKSHADVYRVSPPPRPVPLLLRRGSLISPHWTQSYRVLTEFFLPI